ncbi:MAG TPA: penicillin acylase family protein, partial [Nitrosomonas halophila]|nr:penicillin acylase family protein [Nitrosomonas halophila]
MLRRLLIFLLALAMASLALIWLLLQGSLPAYEGKQPLTGLLSTVAAERDVLGSVTLRADNRSDLARSLGFIHAQERFFEMDLLRRQAAGELAELFGAAALPADRRNRAHRMRARVHAMLAELPDDQRDLLAAYRDGVNQGLDSLQ